VPSATIQGDGTTLRLVTVSAVTPVTACTAGNVALTCAPAGSQAASTCQPDGTTDALAGLGTAVQQGATCTLDVAATTLLDGAAVGGAFRTLVDTFNHATNFAVDDLAVTNQSTQGETAENLLTLATIVPGTCAECAVDRPWSALLDLDTTDPSGSAGNGGITSITGEHDLGAVFGFETFRAFCDALGTWQTQTVTFKYKVNAEDGYTTGVDAQPCNANQWFDFVLGGVSGRYVQIVFTGPAGGTEAREIFLSESPQVLPSPGPRTVVLRGVTLRGGCLGAC
jgi:hypothetical protein